MANTTLNTKRNEALEILLKIAKDKNESTETRAEAARGFLLYTQTYS